MKKEIKEKKLAAVKNFNFDKMLDSIRHFECSKCGREWKRAIDPITGKKSDYLWECECIPGILISVG